jgi:leader peptidase (prepilin peptidase) / N-methyltransferase
VNWFLAVPIELRLAWLFAVGACIGSFLNVCIYRIPMGETVIRGRSHCRKCAAPVRWYHNIPIVSWLALRGRCSQCGERFSVRYLFIEIFTGVCFAALYWWEIGQRGTFPQGMAPPGTPPLALIQHAQYLAHVILLSLMIVASVIDLDYQQIPDAVTVYGTLTGLIAAAAFPWSMLPAWSRVNMAGAPIFDDFLPLTNLHEAWPPWLERSQPWSLTIALGCYLAWWAAVLPWGMGRNRKREFRVLVARLGRRDKDLVLTLIGAVGALAIVAGWKFLGLPQWRGLLTSLVGMAWGGGLVWLLRIVASKALGKEALGFGDVLLMAMIGSFLGWQPVLISFFLAAPILGLIVGLYQWISSGEGQIPYGPYLCLGAAGVVVAWPKVWDHAFATFYVLGWMLPVLIASSTTIMGAMLLIQRFVRHLASKRHDE